MVSRSASILWHISKYHRLKSRRSPVNFSGSGRGFRFRGGFKGSWRSAGLSGSTWITGFGEGFRVGAGVFWAYSKTAIFRDYSWILSRIWSAGVFWARFKAMISNDCSWILSRICYRIFSGLCPPWEPPMWWSAILLFFSVCPRQQYNPR